MNKTDRPRVLESLCWLSFLGSGGGFVLYTAAAIFYDTSKGFILKYSSLSSVDHLPPVYFLLLSLLFSVSLYGVSRMWMLKKTGFFIYAMAQLAILILPVLWMGKAAFSAVALIFTLLFIGAYASQFSKLTGIQTDKSI
jgi:hypothetical protein